MIQSGRLCRSCTNQCREMPTESEPIEIECPACQGRADDCEHCKNGWIKLEGCPSRYCNELGAALKLVALFDKGMAPVAGGVLDQSAWFINAVRLVNNEEARIKAET